ncbi:hypothetical protein [Streptomyces sp. NPDC018000]|uniref:hypothetical protein n=1 Tax=Streptomyces sp. NPDC018000 TaxID=3365028 RepID=UPI00378CB5A5
MAKQGFDYFYDPITIEAARSADDERTRELHGDDVDRARRKGFGTTSPEQEPGRAERRQAAYLDTLTSAQHSSWGRALYGDRGQRKFTVEVPGVGTMEAPTSGCIAHARAELYGDYEKWVRADTFVNSRFLPVNKVVKQQPRYVQATQRWSACMRTKGYHFADPGEAAQSAATTSHTVPGSRTAIQVAVGSAECDQKTGRSKAQRELFEQYTLQWVKDHQSLAADFRKINREALARARTLLRS